MRRPDRILVLAWSLPDVQPVPVSSVQEREQVRAPSPSGWAVCPASTLRNYRCEDGVVVDKFGRGERCAICLGKGRVRVDPYTGADISSADALTLSRTRRVDCDGCGGTGERRFDRCPHCDGAGKVSVPLTPERANGNGKGRLIVAEGEVAKLRETGSYDELERALSRLRTVYPRAWSWWLTVRVEGVAEEEQGGGWLRAGDRFVNEAMPPSIRVPAQVRTAYERWQDGPRRDDRIKAMSRRGVGSEAISVAVGLSRRRVQQVLRGGGRAA